MSRERLREMLADDDDDWDDSFLVERVELPHIHDMHLSDLCYIGERRE